MILGVNGIRLIGMRTGVGRCIEAILRCMGELTHPFSEVRVYTPEPLDDSVKLPACAQNVVLPSTLPLGLWEQFVLPRAHGAKNLLLCPSYVVPVLARCPTLLIHHGSYEGYPQAFPGWPRTKARVMYQLSARRATLISTVSEHSKRDIIRFYKIPPAKIHVIPEGVDTILFRPIADRRFLANWRISMFGADVPFMMYVGKPTKRRNLPALLKAFGLLKKANEIPHKLLLVGTDLPGSPIQPAIAKLDLADEVFTVGFADHQDIAVAYNASELLVYPSSYEGFGMPVLEAMACGTPVIALNNTAFPEFAGGIAHLLENAEVTTLKEGIVTVLSDPQRRAQMSMEGPKRAAAYDWRRVTQRYIALLCRLSVCRTERAFVGCVQG
jgi:glycosyltransferase involved in cell wall biosynthesis